MEMVCGDDDDYDDMVLLDAFLRKHPMEADRRKLDYPLLCAQGNDEILAFLETRAAEDEDEDDVIHWPTLCGNEKAWDMLMRPWNRGKWTIGDLCACPRDELVDWISGSGVDVDGGGGGGGGGLNFDLLSGNENSRVVAYLVEKHPSRINWARFSGNRNELAVKQLIHWETMRTGGGDKGNNVIVWTAFSGNPSGLAVEFMSLEANRGKVCPAALSGNTNDDAVRLLWAHFRDNIDFDVLSGNRSPVALDILTSTPEARSKINWRQLSINENVRAVDMLLADPTKIDFFNASQNASFIHVLLRDFSSEVHWNRLCANTSEHVVTYLRDQHASFRGGGGRPNLDVTGRTESLSLSWSSSSSPCLVP